MGQHSAIRPGPGLHMQHPMQQYLQQASMEQLQYMPQIPYNVMSHLVQPNAPFQQPYMRNYPHSAYFHHNPMMQQYPGLPQSSQLQGPPQSAAQAQNSPGQSLLGFSHGYQDAAFLSPNAKREGFNDFNPMSPLPSPSPGQFPGDFSSPGLR